MVIYIHSLPSSLPLLVGNFSLLFLTNQRAYQTQNSYLNPLSPLLH